MTYLFSRPVIPSLTLAGLAAGLTGPALAHEAWLLTPAEIEALATAPVPRLFLDPVALGTAAVIGTGLSCAALFVEQRVAHIEARIDPGLKAIGTEFGPVFLRLALATMLGLSASGGLPRHGIETWAEPTLFVPDMILSLVPSWAGLAEFQIAIAGLLALGFATRLMGFLLCLLCGAGAALFGTQFLSYAPHFLAPGLILILLGGGACSLDRRLGLEQFLAPPPWWQALGWRIAQILMGLGFIYLAVAYKLVQPTLLIAILQHGQMPTFGLSYAFVALVMTGVELLCGAMLVLGRLVRPVALAIIGAITFLAITLGETPLFHANLYGCMVLFGLIGARLGPVPVAAPMLRGRVA